MKTILKQLISYIGIGYTYIKQYLWVAIAVLVVSLAVTTKVLYDKVQKQDNEIGRLYSNVRQYESLAAGTMAENRVLELKLGDLSHSNDSLVQEIVKSKESP